MTPLSDSAKTVLTYLQEHNGEDLTYKDIAEATGLKPRPVIGVLTGLQKRNLIVRVEGAEKGVKYIQATNEGLVFDVNADPNDVKDEG